VPFDDVQALDAAVDEDTAAVILETIPATAGIVVPSPDYFPAVREICDRQGALLILDEVQTGLGRTGRMWAIDEWDVVPDMMVLGKGMSGGVYPLSVVCYRENVNRFLREHPFAHLSSFGGADLGCVAAMAMLDEISKPGFLAHVRAMGRQFAQGFQRLEARHPDLVAKVRQRGLMIGFELREAAMGPMMTAALGRHGVLAVFADFNPATMQILPPLIIATEEVDEVLQSMERALGEVGEQIARGERLTFAI
jgi:acetylornithine/succinyldiaminopimelate/putrescine aminotransferase